MKKSAKKASETTLAKLKTEKKIPSSLVVPIIAAVALLIRILYYFQLKNNSPVYDRLIHDSALFNELAHKVIEKGLVLDTSFYISPLYTYFLAFVYFVFGDSFDIVRWVQFLMGVGTSLLVFAVAKKYFDKTTALVAGIMTAVYAPFLFFEGNLLGTSVVTFFLLLFFYLKTIKNNTVLQYVISCASGLCLALAITGRPNLILLLPVPLVYYYLSGNSKKQSLLLSGFAFLGILIPLLLTGLHNKKAGGEFAILTTHGGINFFIGNNEKATGAWVAPEGIEASVSAINLEQSKLFAEKEMGKELSSSQVTQFWYKRGLSWGFSHPIKWIGLLGKKFLLFWSGYETPLNFDYYFHQKYSSILKLPFLNLLIYLPFIIIGLFLSAKNWKKLWPIYAVIILVCVSIVMFFMADRYRVVVAPFLIIMAASGIVQLWRLFLSSSNKKWIYSGVLVVLLILQVGYTQNRVKSSNFANDYYNLALSYIIDEDPKSSIFWGQRAALANPSNANTHYNLGVAHMRLKEYDKALDAFETVLELDPASAGANRSVGAILLMRQQHYRARTFLEKSYNVEPNNPQCLMNLGLAYFYARNFQKAITIWQQLEKIDPTNQQVKNNIKAAEYEINR